MDCIKDILFKENSKIVCLQEHWLFNFEKNSLDELFPECEWTVKSVDELNPIGPTQRPRGYGGVAILWREDIKHLIERLVEGSERIVCVKVNVSPKPYILMCVYMPCRGSKYVNSEFNDILDQLREIINKYYPKYQFVLCGDWNCDISSRFQNIKLSERQAAMKNFLHETNLAYNETDVTFIHPNGQEVSTIDYIFMSKEIDEDLNLTKRLDMLPANTSDHHPIYTTIQCHFESKIKTAEKNQYPSKVNWSKIDLEKYQTEITNKINELEAKEKIIDVKDLINALTVVQAKFSKKSKPHKQKNTHIWNDEIALALLNNKKAFI
ncbi:Hypothetical predicted protein [Mytilus galloprovincialis]|uniref:Endonuclease/exonuclease/phosphatase domain-containing protein n=1 Tax=Mytilus galloprovincialis TaxID=29158 RepID=A0A8B6FZ71_MYTGA|nr:Hypothetical predicted protein [Mytilus galloprovincialis]